jgi:ADP-heptose:LPS heptosyltransferase
MHNMSFKINLIKSIDTFWAKLALLPIRKSSRKFSKKDTKSVLFIKMMALGDSINALPLIKAAKKNFNCKVTVATHPRNRAVFECVDFIDEIIDWKTMLKNKYDLVFDLEPWSNISAWWANKVGKTTVGFSHGLRGKTYSFKTEYRKDQHIVQNYLDLIRKLEIKIDTKILPHLEVSKEDEKIVDDWIKSNTTKPLLGLCVTVAESAKYRMWPLERYAELADALAKKYDIIFTGAPNEKEELQSVIDKMKNKAFNMAGAFNLKRDLYLLRKCEIYISNDTGQMHIAAAQGVKTIGLFGPNIPTLWGPYGKNNISLYHKIDCSPCINNIDPNVKDCTNETYQKCILQIKVKEVLDTVKKIENVK